MTMTISGDGTTTGYVSSGGYVGASSASLGSTGNMSSGGAYIFTLAGIKSLSNALDRVRITSSNGTDTFDAGSVNILYEG